LRMRWLQVVLILPIGESVNNTLSSDIVIIMKNAYLDLFLNFYFVFFFSIIDVEYMKWRHQVVTNSNWTSLLHELNIIMDFKLFVPLLQVF
jgi:hypothetical protein